MEHNAPHAGAVFEGYYSKFDLPSGAHIALVICQIKGAQTKPYMVSFTYVPQCGTHVYQREIWADKITMTSTSNTSDCLLDVSGIGFVKWQGDTTAYQISVGDEFAFAATSSDRKPWSSRGPNTPESLLVHLPLPLHWHVHSLASSCSFTLAIRDHTIAGPDASGTALVHQEKNWASSFPSAHMWLQARNPSTDTSFCCAGGQILGLEAFLLGYRSADLDVDFRPPFSTRVPIVGGGPFMSYSCNWEERTFTLSVQSFRQKIMVRAQAPKGSFFSLSSPFPEGHRENYLGQSFKATIEVRIYESGWLTPWKLVREETFEEASLEFGGGYYPPAGSAQRYH